MKWAEEFGFKELEGGDSAMRTNGVTYEDGKGNAIAEDGEGYIIIYEGSVYFPGSKIEAIITLHNQINKQNDTIRSSDEA